MPKNPESPSSREHALTREQEEQTLHWLPIAEQEVQRAQENRAHGLEVESLKLALESIFALWLVPEKLEPLYALATEAEALASPLREQAKTALRDIWSKIQTLRDISPQEEIVDLVAKHKVLSQAVGIVHGGIIDHTR